MPLVAYVFQGDFAANKAGDVVQLEPESAQPLVDAGVLSEATADDVAPEEADAPEQTDEMEPNDVPGDGEKAISRAIADGFKRLQSTLVAPAKKASVPPARMSVPAQVKTPVFKNMSEMLRCVYRAKQGDGRAFRQLGAYQGELRLKSPAGANEGTQSQGGYAVIPEWTEEIFYKVKNLPRLLDLTKRETISSNTLNIPAINETSLADGSRFGGILAYWTSEGSVATTSDPAMTQIQAVLNTQVVIVPITNQLLEDNAYNLDRFVAEQVGEEFVWQENNMVYQGSGSGQPKGILNQSAYITIAKESGQAAGSVVFPNLAKMWGRLYPPYRNEAVWLMNPEVYQQLIQMTFPGSSGTYPAFGFVQWNAHEEFPLRIFGRPCVEVLSANQLGTSGDIVLAALGALTTAEKSGMEVAVSDQVYFTSLQTLFRFVRRYDIQSPWTAALTPYDGSDNTFSPFVGIASRGT